MKHTDLRVPPVIITTMLHIYYTPTPVPNHEAPAVQPWDLMIAHPPCTYLCNRQGIPEQSQIIQPYMFGHLETKATCLWLKGLPLLQPTVDVKEAKRQTMMRPASERSRIHHMAPGPGRWKARSKTFSGIARALATQYGGKI